MNIAFCIDSKLISQACLMIYSLQMQSNGHLLNIYAFLLNVTDSEKKLLQSYVIKPNKLTFCEIKDSELDEITISSNYISKATYLRFFIETKIDSNIEKILYLDCDILVCQDIYEFYNTDIENYSIAACYDLETSDIRRYNRLEYDISDNYFNAGVMLINLVYWRNNNISTKALEYLRLNTSSCILFDQDALNHLLHGTVKYVSSRYNVLCDFFNLRLNDFLLEESLKSVILSEIQNPAIIHYAGFYKPWFKEYYKYNFPFGRIWKKYLELSGISLKIFHIKLINKFSLKSIIKFILIKLGIRKINYPTFVSTSEIENKLLEYI